MFYERMKEAKYQTVNGIQLFEFPLEKHKPPFLPYSREAVFQRDDWRWRDNGTLLSRDEYMDIRAELARRDIEEKLRKAGAQ